VSRAACHALALGCLLAVGCGGGPPADLFVVTRSGDVPGARLELRITDDGRVSCNRGALVDVTSTQLLDAREIARDLVEPAEHSLRLRTGPGSVLRYRARVEDGTVSWSDSSLRQPAVLFRLAKLTRDVAKGPCNLAR
jgi:hypothetical protein